MRQLASTTIVMLTLTACGGAQRVDSPTIEPQPASDGPRAATPAGRGERETPVAPAEPSPGGTPEATNEFVLRTTDKASEGPSKITSTATEAAMKFTVVDKDKGPVEGIVISLTGADGRKFYTEETDAEGRAEVLVSVGQKYDLVFLSLGRRPIAATVSVSNQPKQNIRLTLRYQRQVFEPVPAPATPAAEPRFVLNGVTFDTGKATIRAESFPRLDSVVEYMTYKKSARIEVSGHTDNVGSPKVNKALSEKRAQACRDYLMSKGVDGSRIKAVGYGDQRPIASNDTEDGRQKNRRIEASLL